MGIAIRRSLTNVFLLYDVKATEPQTVKVMDCSFTHVLARCPRAVRVVAICQGQSNL